MDRVNTGFQFKFSHRSNMRQYNEEVFRWSYVLFIFVFTHIELKHTKMQLSVNICLAWDWLPTRSL